MGRTESQSEQAAGALFGTTTRCNFISCFQPFSGITLGLLRDKCAAVL
jgi:hypothetical protein